MIKVYRKGNTIYYKAPGVRIEVSTEARFDLHSVANFLVNKEFPDEETVADNSAPVPRGRKAKFNKTPSQAQKSTPKTPAARGQDDSQSEFNLFDAMSELIRTGCNTEERLVEALGEQLIANGRKSPARSINTALRHAKTRGQIKEGNDGTYVLVTAPKAA